MNEVDKAIEIEGQEMKDAPIYLPTWIPATVPQPAQDRLLEKLWRAGAELKYYRNTGRWNARVSA
jgi:hypothetical protein